MKYPYVLALALLLAGCNEATQEPVRESASVATVAADSSRHQKGVALEVYKSETCGCCEDWMEHMDRAGYGLTAHHPVDLNSKKQSLGIAPRYQSCHTAVTDDGYVFEGHVPAKVVERFLAEKPADAIGLAVPGMPLGSPGMEVEDRFTPYDVVLLKKDGSSEVYARFQTAAEQY
ncbi:DUF411 domain-containing protein [Gilvimarinus sp. F26214L]|uniref:DUF411 domain-containing protein n=1 Tax=Gilvimarinus sp. DZF01 TaxID=3461371 RepID=UPI004045668A